MRHILALIFVLTASPVLAEMVTGLQPGGALALRSGPGVDYLKLGELRAGTRVEVRESNGIWRRVEVENGRWGWVSGRYLSSDLGTAPIEGDGFDLWKTYVNPRFGTKIEYPADVFLPQPARPNVEGRRYLTSDGRAELIVASRKAAPNEVLRNLREYDKSVMRYDEITYEPVGDNWYVLSGYLGQEIFYRRVQLSGGAVHSFELYFPRAERAAWDGPVTRMSHSFGAR